MKTNLNYLFIDQIPNFSHLVNTVNQTKKQFLNRIKNTYSLSNPKTKLFYLSCEKSVFQTIKLSRDRNQILFNQ